MTVASVEHTGSEVVGAPAQAAIQLEHVSKQFDGRPVLDDVSIDVPAGTAFCLLGRSGTGKSVTLKHIIGLMQPDAGRVLVHGVDMASVRGRELARVRRGMGFLFQNAALFDSISVGENVAFPLRRHTDWADRRIREVARSKLADVGLEADYNKMPADLSGGMRKRVGLARAIVGQPRVLLYDEPVTGLDPVNSATVARLIGEIGHRMGVTTVMVTHDVEGALAVCDRIALLHDGRLRFVGSPAAFRRSPDPLVRAFADREAAGAVSLRELEAMATP